MSKKYEIKISNNFFHNQIITKMYPMPILQFAHIRIMPYNNIVFILSSLDF